MKLDSEQNTFNQGLMNFLDTSPTPFHACQNLLTRLLESGYQHIREEDSWAQSVSKSVNSLTGKYVITRNDSSLIAIDFSGEKLSDTGFHLVGAHTDSPCLKLKANAEIKQQGYLQCGVEVYGGVLLNPWFDRDLSLAGRISYRYKDGDVQSCLIDFEKAIATIPSLAIHLDREANEKHPINPQNDIPPILLQLSVSDEETLETLLSTAVLENNHQLTEIQNINILSHELCFYDTQKSAIIGANDDFLCSARLDNLLSCYIAAEALISSSDIQSKQSNVIVFNDHEEVGSSSTSGAAGNFLTSILQRFCHLEDTNGLAEENLYRALKKSNLISADNAHAIHPNFQQKHDKSHGPLINQGPVIKINANQRYASNSETVAEFKNLANQFNIPTQSFVIRTDIACGSTIGPIIASSTGIKTIDVGLATWAMHSIRETAGSKDILSFHHLLTEYFA
ncbi:MAG: M18 family aminopeptidase [Gammaproteobacteria bacterium]|nr:M18 family aminopeptidase [Gammaproteobacteria bacterium]